MIRPGICSVTLRGLGIDEVARRAADAGLTMVEWGADVHVPPGDLAAASRAVRAMAEHGLTCGSYGSYYRGGTDEPVGFDVIARSAVELGASRVRVWAGTTGSATVDAEERARVVDALRSAAEIASGLGLDVALEFHGGTLTDTAESTARLLAEVDRPQFGTYWQPPQDLAATSAVDGLRSLAGHVRAVHVFSWWPGNTRLPLAERSDLWLAALQVVAAWERPVDALLEFVPGDDPAMVAREAETLRRWVSEAGQPTGNEDAR